MRRIHQLSFGLAVLVALSVGSTTALAKSTTKRRNITGVVTSVERKERTFSVRELGTGRNYRVQIPENVLVRDNLSGALVSFERIHAGIIVRDMTIE